VQGYARAELAPAEPEFNNDRTRDDGNVATEVAANTQTRSGRSTSSPVAALLLDGLDETDLGLLAKRLAPHLDQAEEQHPAVPHIAYTVHSLAADLGVSSKAIRCAIARGELSAVKRGSRWIISADAVHEWASPSKARRAPARNCPARAPKTAGPSLRSVLRVGHRGDSR
jgi:excisionase family DNA binding protein